MWGYLGVEGGGGATWEVGEGCVCGGGGGVGGRRRRKRMGFCIFPSVTIPPLGHSRRAPPLLQATPRGALYPHMDSQIMVGTVYSTRA